jgi:hypothetical protein
VRLRVATLDHGGEAATAVTQPIGGVRSRLAAGGEGSSAPWLPALRRSATPARRNARRRGLPSAGPV